MFVCVWGLLIFQHCPTPDACTTQQCFSLHVSPCIYLTVLLKCILTPSMRGSRREKDVFPNGSARHLSPCLFLHQRNSNLGTNLCVVVAKIDELPDWESERLHSRGNNKSLGLPSRRAPWRVACVRRSSPLPCLPHLSSNLSPHHSLPPSIHLPPPIPFLSVTAVTSEVVPGCWGPEGTPLLFVWACACGCTCVPGGRKAHTVYSNGKIQSVDSTHLCILPAPS